LALDTALRKLEALDPDHGRIVELRFFGGLTVEETAQSGLCHPAAVNGTGDRPDMSVRRGDDVKSSSMCSRFDPASPFWRLVRSHVELSGASNHAQKISRNC
jgi:hypothetical protein